MTKEIKSRVQQAHSAENIKRTLPNVTKMTLIFLAGLIIDPHTGNIDPSVIIDAWENHSEVIIGIIGFFGLQDLYRKR